MKIATTPEARRVSYLYWLKERGIPYVCVEENTSEPEHFRILVIVSEASFKDDRAMEMLDKILGALEIPREMVEISSQHGPQSEERLTIEFSLKKDFFNGKPDVQKSEARFKTYDLMAMLEQPALKAPAWETLKAAKNAIKSYLQTPRRLRSDLS